MKTLTRKLKISRVWIEHKVDEHPDLSYLGKFSRTYAAGENPIMAIGEHAGEFVSSLPDGYQMPDARIGLPFFVPANPTPDEDAKADYERMWQYNQDLWHMIGIIAKAEIISPAGIIQTLHSGGLWGVESDSSPEYLAEIQNEQIQELRSELESLGIGKRAIDYAMKRVDMYWVGSRKGVGAFT